MSKTRRELIDKTLLKLGILVPGQAPGDETVSMVDGFVDPCFARLLGKGIGISGVDVGLPNPPSGGDIDDAVFLSLTDCLADACKGAFNLSDSPYLKLLADQAEEELRIITRPAATRVVLHTDTQLRGSKVRAPIGNFTRGT